MRWVAKKLSALLKLIFSKWYLKVFRSIGSEINPPMEVQLTSHFKLSNVGLVLLNLLGRQAHGF